MHVHFYNKCVCEKRKTLIGTPYDTLPKNVELNNTSFR